MPDNEGTIRLNVEVNGERVPLTIALPDLEGAPHIARVHAVISFGGQGAMLDPGDCLQLEAALRKFNEAHAREVQRRRSGGKAT
jgi:hypothetical protein